MEKVTITEKINGIKFNTLTKADFEFLKERALKSVRKANPDKKNSETVKHDKEREEVLAKLAEGAMSPADISKMFGLDSTQKGSGLIAPLVKAGKVEKFSQDGKVFYRLPE